VALFQRDQIVEYWTAPERLICIRHSQEQRCFVQVIFSAKVA
jgi:hypothetical protein